MRDDDAMGLTGGVSGYAGVAPKKSWIFRKFGLSPLQFAGYASILPVLFHVTQMRLIPLFIDGDSSCVTMDYVSHIFGTTQGLWRPLLNWVVYPPMILMTTYHTIYGMLRWLRVKDLKLRKVAVNVISLISLCGVWSIYTVSKMESTAPGFIQKKFDKYLDVLYFGKLV